MQPEPNGRARSALEARVGGLPPAFWWLWIGTLINRAGTFVEPFLVLYLTGPRHLSVTAAGAVVTAWGAGSLVSQPLGGFLADRVGRRATLSIGMVSTGLALGALAVGRGLPQIVAATVVVGVVGDIYRPAASAIVADLLDGPARTRGFALQFWAINLGFSVATLSAGFLARAGFGLLFALDAATSIVFGLVVLRGVPETRPPAPEHDDGPSALRLIAADRMLLLALSLGLAYGVLYTQAYLTLPLAITAAGLSTAAYGVVIAVNGVLIVVLQPVLMPWLTRARRVVVLPVSMALVGAGMALSGVCTTTWQFGLTVVVWTLGEIGQATAFQTMVAELAPVRLRGRYLGAFGLSWGLSGILAPLLGTRLYALTPNGLWLACLGLGLVAAAGQRILVAGLDSRHQPGQDTPAVAVVVQDLQP